MAWDTNRQEGDVLTAQDWNQAVQEIKSKQSRLNVVDTLDSTSSVDVLSAKQGKVLNEKINSATSTITVISEKVDKLPIGMYYGSFASVENLPDAEHRDYKGYAYVPTTDAGIYYIYTTDGNSTDWVLSENKFYSTNLETNLANKSEDKAPTTKIVAEGIEAIDVTSARSAEDENELTATQKYNASANINNRTAVVDQQTSVLKSLGYKVLNPNASFASQVEGNSNANMIFEIRDEFNLDPKSINADYAETTWDEYVVINHKRYYYNSSSVIEITPSDSPSGKVILYSKEPSCLLKLNPNVVYKNNAIINQDISAYLALEESTSTTYKIDDESGVTIYLESSPVTISDNDYFLSNAIELSDSEQITVGSRYVIINAAGDTILSSNGSYTASGNVSVKVGKKLIASTITTACSISTYTVIPANCTLKFNGGKLKNGTVSGIGLKAEGLNKIVLDEKVFSHGVNLNVQEDYVLASTVGFVENNQDATAVAYNDSILETVISSGKFLDIDIDMYIGGTHTIASRDFKIRGTGVLRALSGAHFYMGASGYLEIDNITLYNNSHSFISITASKLTHLIKGIVLDYVTLYSDTRFINIYGEDQNYAVNNFGIENFSITNCNYYVEANYTQIIIADVPVTKVFSISNNYIKGVGYQFINAGTGNSYVNNNYDYYTEYVVQNNTVIGRIFKSTSQTYSCFCLIEAPIVKYIGNNVNNLISTGVQGAAYPVYDSYLSCNILYYTDNIITNVVELPEDGVALDTLTEFAKSKGNGESDSRRYISNNKFKIDFDECRQLVKDNLNTEWTDEAFNAIKKVGLFFYTSEIELLDFRSNIVEVINGQLSFPTSAYTMRTVVKAIVDNNIFNVGKASSDGAMLLYHNAAAVSRVFTNNKVIVDTGTTFNVFTTYDNASTNNNCEIVIKNNISNVPFTPTFAEAKSVIITDNVITEYAPIKRIINIYSANLNNSFIEFKKELHLSSISESNNYVIYVNAVNTKLYLKTSGTIFVNEYCDHAERVGIKSPSKVTFQFGNNKRQFILIPGESYYINEYNAKVEYGSMFSEAFKISSDEVVRFRAYSTGTIIMGIEAINGCTIEIEPITSVENQFQSYDVGLTKFDNGRPIFYNGTAWVDALGEPAGLQVSDTSVLIGANANDTKEIKVYSSTPTTVVLQNPDGTTTDLWLSSSIWTNSYTTGGSQSKSTINSTSYYYGSAIALTDGETIEVNGVAYILNSDKNAIIPFTSGSSYTASSDITIYLATTTVNTTFLYKITPYRNYNSIVVLKALTANTTNPRGAKVIISNGTDVVIVNVVQNYV